MSRICYTLWEKDNRIKSQGDGGSIGSGSGAGGKLTPSLSYLAPRQQADEQGYGLPHTTSQTSSTIDGSHGRKRRKGGGYTAKQEWKRQGGSDDSVILGKGKKGALKHGYQKGDLWEDAEMVSEKEKMGQA